MMSQDVRKLIKSLEEIQKENSNKTKEMIMWTSMMAIATSVMAVATFSWRLSHG